MRVTFYHFRRIPIGLFLLAFSGLFAQDMTIYVSEFMTANGSIYADEFGEYDDWIELYNYGTDPIDIQGMYISDDKGKPEKTLINNSIIIQPNGYVVLWADGTPDQGERHLNFKLANGDDIILSSENKVIDDIEIKNQRYNISYGRKSHTVEDFFYYQNPTPLTSNNTEALRYLPSVEVSHQTGNYESPISVNLVGENDALIYYTLDGSMPSRASILYENSPIEINQNMILRAISFKENYLTPIVTNNTYIFNEPSSIPVLYLTSNGNVLNGETKVSVHAELIDKEGEQLFSEQVASKRHGAEEQLSFRLSFGAKHGGEKVRAKLFTEKPDVDQFESLVFRQSGNDGLNTSSSHRSHLRDGYISTIVNRGDFNFKAPGFRQVNVYLDGKYYGVFNLRERVDLSFIENNYDIKDADPKCFIEYKFGESNNVNVIEGYWSFFEDRLWSPCKDANLSAASDFQKVADVIDLNDFTDYWIHEVYIGNYDWLSNNMYFWSPYDRRANFRWILWDTDVSMGLNGDPDWNSLEWATSTEEGRPQNGERTAIIRGLLTNSNYEQFFITRFCDLLNSEYLPTNMVKILDDLAENVSLEIPKHTSKWGRGSLETWEKELDVIRSYVTERPEHVHGHIKSKFPLLSDMYSVELKTSIPNAASFDVNTIEVSSNEIPWNGKYFSDLPLSLTVYPNDGYNFLGWQHTTDTSETIVLNPNKDTSIVALFELKNESNFDVIINEISYKQTESFDSGDWVELYNKSDRIVDMSAWEFIDDSESNEAFSFPTGSELKPNEYLILVNDRESFNKVYPGIIAFSSEISFGFNKKRETLKLYNNLGIIVDSVGYLSEDPWPNLEVSNSIQLLDHNLDNNKGESWIVSSNINGTPGLINDKTSSISNPSGISNKPFQVFPNPARSYVQIYAKDNGELKIYDYAGSLIDSFSMKEKKINLDIAAYAPGYYVFNFKDKDGKLHSTMIRKEE